METEGEPLTCACPHCGGLIEFPSAWAGAGVDCPHCGVAVNLVETGPEEAREREGEAGGVDIAGLAAAFRGRVERRGVSVGYQVALVLGAAAMVTLPAVYGALVGMVGWGMWVFGWGWFDWVGGLSGGTGWVVLKVAGYVLGWVAWLVVGLFLVKPWFARRARHATPLALNPAAEPALFAFLHMVADTVRAPRPTRVAVDCQLNASAGMRGGLGGGELVLTLGLPLVAVLSLRQLAGVLAHEMAHFNQGFGLRASRLVWGINAWLARVAYERDGWDEVLQGWAREAPPLRRHVVLGAARLGVWGTRFILKVLLRGGHAVSCLMLRQMEREADRCQVEVAGTDAFEATLRRVRVVQEVARDFYRRMRSEWERDRRLPEDFPAALAAANEALPKERRQRIEDESLRAEAGVFATHPADGERLAKARERRVDGLFTSELPAAALFVNFRELCRQVTVLHYEDDLGLPRELVEGGREAEMAKESKGRRGER